MIGKLAHYAADAILVSAVIAGIKRSTVRDPFSFLLLRFIPLSLRLFNTSWMEHFRGKR